MGEMSLNLSPDFFSLRQYIWGTFSFSGELPEGLNIHPLDTVNISAAWLVIVQTHFDIGFVSDQ